MACTGDPASSASRTLRCMAPKTSDSWRKRTSAFVGCTLTSTSCGGNDTLITAMGLRPPGSSPWYASATAKVRLRFCTGLPFTISVM